MLIDYNVLCASWRILQLLILQKWSDMNTSFISTNSTNSANLNLPTNLNSEQAAKNWFAGSVAKSASLTLLVLPDDILFKIFESLLLLEIINLKKVHKNLQKTVDAFLNNHWLSYKKIAEYLIANPGKMRLEEARKLFIPRYNYLMLPSNKEIIPSNKEINDLELFLDRHLAYISGDKIYAMRQKIKKLKWKLLYEGPYNYLMEKSSNIIELESFLATHQQYMSINEQFVMRNKIKSLKWEQCKNTYDFLMLPSNENINNLESFFTTHKQYMPSDEKFAMLSKIKILKIVSVVK